MLRTFLIEFYRLHIPIFFGRHPEFFFECPVKTSVIIETKRLIDLCDAGSNPD